MTWIHHKHVAFLTFCFFSFSGTAAFNIGGQTLHNTFRLPVRRGPYTPLKEESANTLRMQFLSVRILIIDEVTLLNIPYISPFKTIN